MNQRIGRRLSDGISAKMEFDYACNRAQYFGEHYLHGVVNEILASNIDPVVYVAIPDHPHPAIQVDTEQRRGRNREVDFYIESREEQLGQLCIEVKWAGSSHCTPKSILLDICRLAAIKSSSPEAECLMVLSGGKSAVLKMLTKAGLAPSKGGRGRILKKPRLGRKASTFCYTFDESDDRDRKLLQYFDSRLPSLPKRLATTLVDPKIGKDDRWLTLVWKVERCE